MPAKKQDKVLLVCPHCGHEQPEPRGAFSTICKKCGRHLRVQEVLNPQVKAAEKGPQKQLITCFDCGTELEVSVSAESTICKRCSAYVDLHNYNITNALAKNFKTKGEFTIELKGWVFNTDSVVGNAVIRGRYHGKLAVERSLTIYSTAELKGTITAGHLIIPEKNHFRWDAPIRVGSAEISGELAADLCAEERVVVKASARLFGNVDAGALVVEEGAIIVGRMQTGRRNGGGQGALL
ncbi:MAG TPA: polymer-forming cytoskeletal protein [Verrucomicrobiae bacterium]|jgi:cytoskeletal protein CcmA (bactofilin family)/ribosomal protein L37AE/L43A|nr:polymer-forming cytoskeletal protein [Verrucomicrobiae bacterium]